MTAFTPDPDNQTAATLSLAQIKTLKCQVLHVPAPLALIFADTAKRGTDRHLASKTLSFENRPIRALTSHDGDQPLEVYMRGVKNYPMANLAQGSPAKRFAEVMDEASRGANKRRFSGATGRAVRQLSKDLPQMARAHWPRGVCEV